MPYNVVSLEKEQWQTQGLIADGRVLVELVNQETLAIERGRIVKPSVNPKQSLILMLLYKLE